MKKQVNVTSLVICIFLLSAILIHVSCDQTKALIQERKEIARSVMDEAWNKGNLNILDEYYSPNLLYHASPFLEYKSLQEYKKYIADIHVSYPDVKLIVDEVIVEGNKDVVRGRFTGTQTGPSPSLGVVTGKKVDIPLCSVSHWADGKIVEVHNFVNWTVFMQQLGYKMSPPVSENTFARVTITEGKVDMMEEMVQVYKDSVVSAAKSQKGYRGILLLSDLTKGKSISISIWDSEEDAVNNEQSGYYKAQVDKFKDMLTATPVREGYSVTVQE